MGKPNEDAIASGQGQEDQPEPIESKDTFVVQVHGQRTLNLTKEFEQQIDQRVVLPYN